MRELREHIDNIQELKQELLLRFGLLGQTRHLDPALELMAGLRKINRDIEKVSKKLRHCQVASAEEEQYLGQLRALEDKRFQLLSQMNGSKISDYNLLSPRYSR